MPGGAANQEAGAKDNLLELNPNDENFAFAQDWEDGKTYVIHELRVTQVSPGKFTPVSAEGGEEASEESGEMPMGGEEMGEGMMGGGKEYPNPAVANLAKSRKS